MIAPRVLMVKAPVPVLSAYDKAGVLGRPRAALVPMHERFDGRCTADMAAALAKAETRITVDGGDLRLSDLWRSIPMQALARKKYETWDLAGKPKPGTPAFNPNTMKAAFVALPGHGFHNAGRGMDVDHLRAAPATVPYSKKLDWLWDRLIPLGFTPAIKTADEGAKESWHFDFMGEWRPVYQRLGYEQAALAACLDVVEGMEAVIPRVGKRLAMFLQAQLQRAGYDCGKIDGDPGEKTRLAAVAVKIPVLFNPDQTVSELACNAAALLPSSPTIIWKP